MTDSGSRSGHRLAAFLPLMAALLAVACAPASKVHSTADAPPIRFQYIYVVHGDAGYTWYDAAGNRHSADLEALDQAARVARESPAAEVFVFHQKPKCFLGIFPGTDGALSVYRHGRLVLSRDYDRPGREAPLAAEARLFHALAAGPRGPTGTGRVEARVFAYFGHEIPATTGQAYSRSRPDTGFAMKPFAAGLGLFANPQGADEGKAFELVILSACHGGTPGATRALAPYASWLLAAPGELHLSYLDTRALSEMADAGAPPLEAGEIGTWGRIIASESFEKLKKYTVTEITLSLYDTDRAAAWLDARPFAADGASGTAGYAGGYAGYGDCGSDPAFGAGGEDAGVLVFHRPPRFGRDKHKAFRSGWECKVAAKAE